MDQVENKRIWIIGASSGIGAALATELSKAGAHLILSARRGGKLKELNDNLGGAHEVSALDVSDLDALSDEAKKLFKAGDIDSIIFLAGLYEPTPIRDIKPEDFKKIIDVNLGGAFNILNVVLPQLRAQSQKGQIVLCGSVAGYVGLPNGQPYSATKAAITNLAESLYAEERDLDVKLISPGFVETPLTDKNDFEMPMKIQPDEAAKAIAKGLLSNSFEIHFPKKFTFIMKFLRLLPYALYLPLARKVAKKRENA